MNRSARRIAQVCKEIIEKKTTFENAVDVYNLTEIEQKKIKEGLERLERLGNKRI